MNYFQEPPDITADIMYHRYWVGAVRSNGTSDEMEDVTVNVASTYNWTWSEGLHEEGCEDVCNQDIVVLLVE